MIRSIAAIDTKRGIANGSGIPWSDMIPGDVEYFRQKTLHSTVLMGYNTYKEFNNPLSNRRNVVLCKSGTLLRPGFESTSDTANFLATNNEDIWIIGGAKVFEATLHLADELYITQLDEDFGCTKFFPYFKNDFKLVTESAMMTENSIDYKFQIWKKIA